MKFNLLSCIRNSDEEKSEKAYSYDVNKQHGSQALQFIAAISACISGIGFGACETWTSPALPYLKSQKSEFPVSVVQGSWIASLFSLGGIFGYIMYPLLVNRIGRKNSLLLFSLPQIIGWMTTIFAKSYVSLYISRIISGIGYCSSLGLLVIYLGEIADKDIRGILLFIIKISYDIGILVVAVAGAFLSYHKMNCLLLSLPIFFLATFLFMPETPYYYLLRGDDKMAIKTLMKLQGFKDSDQVKVEIERMKLATKEENLKGNSLWKLFRYKKHRKALMIALCADVTKVFSGYFAILTYTQTIFCYNKSSIDPKYATIIMVVVKIVSGLFASQLIESVGRRILVIFSGIFASISLAIVGTFYYLQYLKVDYLPSISWLPLMGLTCFEVFCAFGVSPMPFVLLGELFPTDVKGPATACVTIITEFLLFIVTFGFEVLNKAEGIYTSFWIYAICCFIGSVTLFFVMPETKGRNLEEIQHILEKKKCHKPSAI